MKWAGLFVPPIMGAVMMISGAAFADPYADVVESSSGVTGQTCCDDPQDALEAPDATGNALANFAGFVTIENGGMLTVNFTDNLCFEDGDGASPDLRVYEYLDADETFTVAVGLDGNPLSATVNGETEIGEEIELNGVLPSGAFNQAQVTSTSNGGVVPGVDIDALECFWTLDQGDIDKTIVTSANKNGNDTPNDDDIFFGIDVEQHKAFTIRIENDTGVDGAFSGQTFMDVVPAEFDVVSVTVDNASEADDADECSANFAEHQSQGKSGKEQFKPDFITIDAGGLEDGEACTITVEVVTVARKGGSRPGRGNSPEYTPTSCPIGGVILNDGVRLIDDSTAQTIFEDDDSLTLNCDL